MTLDPEITRLALRTLEDALAQAVHGPVKRRWGQRLALTWLFKAGIAQRWQCIEFWKVMAERTASGAIPDHSQYIRITTLTGLLDYWHLELSPERPTCVARAKWAGAYAPAIEAGDEGDHARRMCNRYQPGERHRIEDLFRTAVRRQFNAGPETVHPKEPGWIVRLEDGERVLEQMTWGFPVVLKGKQGQPLKPKPVNNARFDKLGTFWRRWAADPLHRCLIPAARFAEPAGERGRMTETWLSLKGQPLFAWAGLWRRSDEWGECYTGVMTDCALDLAHIHDRAPVILEPDDWQAWLTEPLADLYRFDRALPAERMEVEATGKLWAER